MGELRRTIVPAVTYQGGKGRLGGSIVETIGLPTDGQFFDLCCGSGAVSIAAIKAGQPADRITMIDVSPWGLFWRMIGNGSFDIDRLEAHPRRRRRSTRGITPCIPGPPNASTSEDSPLTTRSLSCMPWGTMATPSGTRSRPAGERRSHVRRGRRHREPPCAKERT